MSGLDAALEGLAATARTRPVLVGLDFDGVLAPLQDDPAASRVLPSSAAALERLAGSGGVRLALVSGRDLADLAALAQVPPGTLLVGSHGAERGRVTPDGLERERLELDPAAATLRRTLGEELDAAVAGTTAWVQHKPAAVVLHTRTASRADADRLTATALGLERPGVDVLHGKDVVELSVLRTSKGDALADLRAATGAAGLLYAGDDVTDERAFATLGPDDVTVRVGDGDTAARFRVADPDAVAALLARLADLLEG